MLQGRSLPGPADFHIKPLAERSRWFRVDTDSEWFYEVAWDIGLAAISPDGRRLAVLAATDSD